MNIIRWIIEADGESYDRERLKARKLIRKLEIGDAWEVKANSKMRYEIKRVGGRWQLKKKWT